MQHTETTVDTGGRYGEPALCALRGEAEKLLSPKRFGHTLGVENKAAELAAIYCPEYTGLLRAAALLHDITKEQSTAVQIELCAKYGVPVTEEMLDAPKLFHSATAAALIPDRFPEYADPVLLRAISLHTTGAESMTLCDKILYLADYIEDTRVFPDCVRLRGYFDRRISKVKTEKARLRALDDTLLLSFNLTIRDIINNNQCLAPSTVKARNALLRHITKNTPRSEKKL